MSPSAVIMFFYLAWDKNNFITAKFVKKCQNNEGILCISIFVLWTCWCGTYCKKILFFLKNIKKSSNVTKLKGFKRREDKLISDENKKKRLLMKNLVGKKKKICKPSKCNYFVDKYFRILHKTSLKKFIDINNHF